MGKGVRRLRCSNRVQYCIHQNVAVSRLSASRSGISCSSSFPVSCAECVSLCSAELSEWLESSTRGTVSHGFLRSVWGAGPAWRGEEIGRSVLGTLWDFTAGRRARAGAGSGEATLAHQYRRPTATAGESIKSINQPEGVWGRGGAANRLLLGECGDHAEGAALVCRRRGVASPSPSVVRIHATRGSAQLSRPLGRGL